MGYVVGRWKIKPRTNPIGRFIFLFGGVEFVLVAAVLLTIFMQFRSKLLSILDKIFATEDFSCGLEAGCGQVYSFFSIPVVVFTGWFIILVWQSARNSKMFRRCCLEMLVPVLAFVGSALVFIEYVAYAMDKQIDVLKIATGFGLLLLAFFLAFFEVEKISERPLADGFLPLKIKFDSPIASLNVHWAVFFVVMSLTVCILATAKDT
jgi:hypothetical protein